MRFLLILLLSAAPATWRLALAQPNQWMAERFLFCAAFYDFSATALRDSASRQRARELADRSRSNARTLLGSEAALAAEYGRQKEELLEASAKLTPATVHQFIATNSDGCAKLLKLSPSVPSGPSTSAETNCDPDQGLIDAACPGVLTEQEAK